MRRCPGCRDASPLLRGGGLPRVEWNQLLLRPIRVDGRKIVGGDVKEVGEVATVEGVRWWRGEEDVGECEWKAHGGEGQGECGAGCEVADAVEEHVRDGVVDGVSG